MAEVNQQPRGKGPVREPPKPKCPRRQAIGRHSHRQGKKAERDAVRALQKLGVPIIRGFGDRSSGDSYIDGYGKVEIKCGYGGWKTIYRFLGNHFALMFRGDRQEWLITMKAKDFARLIKNGGSHD